MTLRTLKNVAASRDAWDWDDLRRHCLAITRRYLEPADAEDAAQEAVVRAWTAAGRAAIHVPKAWLTRAAQREALRIVERAQVLAGRRAPLEVNLVAADDWQDALHDRIAMDAGLAGLDLPDAEVLRLRYVEDRTQADVAASLGIPEGTAKARLHRARRRLAARMGA